MNQNCFKMSTYISLPKFQYHSVTCAANNNLDNVIDFSAVKLWYFAHSVQANKRLKLLKLLDYYRCGTVAIAWIHGIPVFVGADDKLPK